MWPDVSGFCFDVDYTWGSNHCLLSFFLFLHSVTLSRFRIGLL